MWDHANFAYDNMMALRSVGVECRGMKLEKHPFNYPEQLEITTKDQIIEAAKQSDVIQIFHSSRPMLNIVKNLSKALVVYHCSSDYRTRPIVMNEYFNRHVEKSVLCLTEFWGLGAKNPVYMTGGLRDDGKISYKRRTKPVFAHYPSNPEIKGTREIIQAFDQADIDLKWSTEQVSSEDQKKRMNGCDVYVELYKPYLYGQNYGSFGITALEAAAMGKVVVTQCLNLEVYERHYGDIPFFCVENYSHLVSTIRHLNSLKPFQIRRLQRKTREWFVRNHSYEATGNYIKNNVL